MQMTLGLGALARVEAEVADAARDDQADVRVLQVVDADALLAHRRHLGERHRDLERDGVRRGVQPVEVLRRGGRSCRCRRGCLRRRRRRRGGRGRRPRSSRRPSRRSSRRSRLSPLPSPVCVRVARQRYLAAGGLVVRPGRRPRRGGGHGPAPARCAGSAPGELTARPRQEPRRSRRRRPPCTGSARPSTHRPLPAAARDLLRRPRPRHHRDGRRQRRRRHLHLRRHRVEVRLLAALDLHPPGPDGVLRPGDDRPARRRHQARARRGHLRRLRPVLGLVLARRPRHRELADAHHRVHRDDGGDEPVRRAAAGSRSSSSRRSCSPSCCPGEYWTFEKLTLLFCLLQPGLHPGGVLGDGDADARRRGAQVVEGFFRPDARAASRRAALHRPRQHRHDDRAVADLLPAERGGGQGARRQGHHVRQVGHAGRVAR